MLGDMRRVVVIGALVVFGAGFLIGLAVGRAGDDGDVRVITREDPSPDVVTEPTLQPSLPVSTPTPEDQPAIPTQGAVLREGTRPVVPAAANAQCQQLVTPGALGECGEVRVGANRVVWVVERTSTPSGATAILARMLSFVPETNGWVEWLQAADPTGDQWSDVNVIPSDLTGDGVPELLVGFRRTNEATSLDLDIVGFGQDNLPVVLAHPDLAPRGSVVVTGGTVQEYVAQYPGGEPACCPASFLRQTIAFEDGFFRIIGGETVSPNVVPASQL